MYESQRTIRMTIYQVSITPRGSRPKSSSAGDLAREYIQRSTRYCPVEQLTFNDEDAFSAWMDHSKGRTGIYSILLDSRGKQLTSEQFARTLVKLRDEGQQRIVLAIGPANGWSAATRRRAQLLFSLGQITLPHELASAVLAEQTYRALTILAGHPYHSGH
ncbi:MAG: hypothetical protein JWQ42_610 [Edaphobacter sp.]|nr:hypothetical protein [Edaphobacter sp.]